MLEYKYISYLSKIFNYIKINIFNIIIKIYILIKFLFYNFVKLKFIFFKLKIKFIFFKIKIKFIFLNLK